MKKTPKPRDTVQRLKETIHKQPAVFAVYVALRLIVLAELVMSIIRGEYESAFICLLVLALFILPFFIQQNFGIQLPSVLEIIILLFIFAAEILGELECYFITYPNWDSMLHTTTGFLCAATGFALIDILNRNSRIKFQLSPVYVALAAFCFSMTVGGAVGVFRVRHGPGVPSGYAEGHRGAEHYLRDAGPHQQQYPHHHRRHPLGGRQRHGSGL